MKTELSAELLDNRQDVSRVAAPAPERKRSSGLSAPKAAAAVGPTMLPKLTSADSPDQDSADQARVDQAPSTALPRDPASRAKRAEARKR